MSLEASDCLRLSNLHRTLTKAGDESGSGLHLPHCIHRSAYADLGLDGVEVVVEQHAHAGLHGDSKPKQEVVVLAEKRVLQVDGRVGDDQETGQGCGQASDKCCVNTENKRADGTYQVWRG